MSPFLPARKAPPISGASYLFCIAKDVPVSPVAPQVSIALFG
jgi:hypothetical protein